MSNTPRSDQEWVNSYCEYDQGTVAMYHFAQKLELELASMTSERDALLLEFAPERMTKEQLEEWGKNQVPAPDQDYLEARSRADREEYLSGSGNF